MLGGLLWIVGGGKGSRVLWMGELGGRTRLRGWSLRLGGGSGGVVGGGILCRILVLGGGVLLFGGIGLGVVGFEMTFFSSLVKLDLVVSLGCSLLDGCERDLLCCTMSRFGSADGIC